MASCAASMLLQPGTAAAMAVRPIRAKPTRLIAHNEFRRDIFYTPKSENFVDRLFRKPGSLQRTAEREQPPINVPVTFRSGVTRKVLAVYLNRQAILDDAHVLGSSLALLK